MFINRLIQDIVLQYMRIGTYWLLFIYTAVLLFSVIFVNIAKIKQISITKTLMIIALFFYILTLIVSTTVARRSLSGHMIRLFPFYSWKMVLRGNKTHLVMVLENIIMMMPIGFLLPLINKKRNNAVMIVIIGSIISSSIECTQYVFYKGWFEIEDIFNNSIGTLIGYMAYSLVQKISDRIKRNFLGG